MKTATLKETTIEIPEQGYKLAKGYIVYTPEGNELQPYMRCREAIRFCKAQGWKYQIV